MFLVLFFALLYIQFIDDGFSRIRGSDTASYLLLAKSIATGYGFSDINLPWTPPHTQYPPLFPLLLSPFYALFGYNMLWMRLVVIVFGLASLYLVKLFFDRECGEEEGARRLSFSVVLLVGTSFYTVYFAREVLPEIPYLFFSFASLLLLKRYVESARLKGVLLLAPVLVPLAYFTKFIGVSILAAVVAVLLLKLAGEPGERREYLKKLIYFSFAGVLPYFLWMARNSVHSIGVSTYQAIFVQADYYDIEGGTVGLVGLAGRLAENSVLYAREIPNLLLTYLDLKNALPHPVFKALVFFVLAMVLLGLFYRLYKKRGVVEFYVAAYLAILLVWPVYGSGDARRYLVPLIPFLYYYFFAGTMLLLSLKGNAAGSEKGKGTAQVRIKGVVTVFVVFFLFLNVLELRDFLWPPTAAVNLKRSVTLLVSDTARRVDKIESEKVVTTFIKELMPCHHRYIKEAGLVGRVAGPDALIMTRKPEIVAIVSGSYTIRFPFTKDEAKMTDFIKRNKVTHLLLDSCYEETGDFLTPFVVARKDEVSVLRVDGQSTGVVALGFK